MIMTAGMRIGISTVLACAGPAATQAQDSAQVAVVRSLLPGQTVRVDLAERGRLEGRFHSTTTQAVTLTVDTATTRFPVMDLERLWVRQSAAGRGALIGAGVGLLAGIVTGLIIGPIACEPVDGGDCTTGEVTLVTGLVGGAGGALLGAGTGLLIPIWKLRFPL